MTIAFIALAWMTSIPVLPVDAIIVDMPSPTTQTGNVMVIFSDLHHEKWTRRGGCSMPQVSSNGLVGWVHDKTSNRAEGSYLNYPDIVICWPDGHSRKIRDQDYPYLDDWRFDLSGRTLVMEAGFRHGPRHFIEYEIKTGAVVPVADTPPAWWPAYGN